MPRIGESDNRFSFPTRRQINTGSVFNSYAHILKRPSIDTFYQVSFAFSQISRWMGGQLPTDYQRKLSLMCSEAEIPGSSFMTIDTVGDHQGITEAFPTLRQFPPLNLTFYLDAQHEILEIFEKWMYYINPLARRFSDANTFSRLKYPEQYKEIINITKYERDFSEAKNYMISPARPADVPDYVPPRYPTETHMRPNYKSKMTTYKFINTWPTNLTSMRVQYGNSDVVKLSIQFVYDRYYTQFGVVDSQVAVTEYPENMSNDIDIPGWMKYNSGLVDDITLGGTVPYQSSGIG